jgi:glycosyltransferase involved in cell wall biosynthesis
VIHNPVITPDFVAQASAPLDHPWFGPGQPPVVIGVGSLTKAKDFETLIRAFGKVRATIPARLVILGEGEERKNLELLVKSLGLLEDVELTGFVENPFAYMSRATVFVLSSRWEGFGLVLAEALACGTPAISTNCPSGPSEILEDGKLGRLVAVGDVEGLAKEILEQLGQIPDPKRLRQFRSKFSLESVVDEYLSTLQLRPKGGND